MVLLKELRHINDQIADYRQSRQRPQYNRFGQLIQIGRACKPIFTIDIHRIGTAYTLTARAAQRQRIIHICFNALQSVQQHFVGVLQLYCQVLHIRFRVLIWIVTVDLKLQSACHNFSFLRNSPTRR